MHGGRTDVHHGRIGGGALIAEQLPVLLDPRAPRRREPPGACRTADRFHAGGCIDMAASDGGDRVRFGARLRHAREAGRLSLGEVAARSGVTKSFLSRVERDMTSPSLARLMGICDALGLSMAELFQTPQTTLMRRDDRPRIADLPKAAGVVDTLITPAGER